MPTPTIEEISKGIGARLISAREVQLRTSLSRASIWRLMKAGQFPRSIELSPGRKAWRESDISQWIEEKSASLNADDLVD